MQGDYTVHASRHAPIYQHDNYSRIPIQHTGLQGMSCLPSQLQTIQRNLAWLPLSGVVLHYSFTSAVSDRGHVERTSLLSTNRLSQTDSSIKQYMMNVY